ncbi:MAG: FCD domain-containing protein [Burkholderiales bacterium]|nr:FCD domain-containing protein [Burkholderiales bacterium]
MILDGELQRGARVNEFALAARLGVSRGPVREACRSLTQAGLLEARSNRGFFVRKLALKEVIDLYDLRAGLMRVAGALIANRATAAEIARLRALVEEMERARGRADHERFLELNAGFHGALVEAADNRRLREVCDGLAKELRIFRRRGLLSGGAMESSNREHGAIVDAIAARDAERAAAAMEGHILRGKARFLAAAVDEFED